MNNHKQIPRVALLIESSRNYGRGILQGIARYARENGSWSCYTQERELHSGLPEWLKTWRGDGIIARIEDRRMAKQLLKLGVPVVDVLAQTRHEHIVGFDTDAAAVARVAADFFLQAGFENFAYSGYMGIPFSDKRGAAFESYLHNRGKKVLHAPSEPGLAELSHIQAMEQHGMSAQKQIARWLKTQTQPLALFACNDVRAQQVLNACREHGIRVPEDVSVMGVDNDDVLCGLCDPPLSSIEPNTDHLGYEAAATLGRMMAKKPPQSWFTSIAPLRLVERTSADVIAMQDPVMVQAIRFIRSEVGNGIAVKDVLNHVNRSRTDLEYRFRMQLKTSIHGEIQRRRIDRVSALLRETDLPVNEVARKSGFATAAHLCRLFRRHYQQTPTEFRAQSENRQPYGKPVN